jgi:protein-disulfide isomerase
VLVTALSIVALAISIALPGQPALAGSEPGLSGEPSLAPAGNSFDAKLKDFLQKRFLIDNPDHIQIGPSAPTPLHGIVRRIISVTNDRGQSGRAEVFTDSTHRAIILGQMYNLSKDPWQRVDMKRIDLADRPVMGPANAPVTIVEFADFECPYCARAFGLMETMVHTTFKGKIRFIFKDFPINGHPWAARAAVAAECARMQNPEAFWSFAREFYTNQTSIDPGDIGRVIDATAKHAGLDAGILKACMAGKSALANVSRDARDGVTLGVTSTPTFFVNGVRVVGLPEEKSFEFVIREQIEQATARARR